MKIFKIIKHWFHPYPSNPILSETIRRCKFIQTELEKSRVFVLRKQENQKSLVEHIVYNTNLQGYDLELNTGIFEAYKEDLY